MKKIITLFASVILVASAFAQYNDNNQGYGRKSDRDIVYNDGKFDKRDRQREGRYSFTKRERDYEISRINQEYNNKIKAVTHRWFTSNARKQRVIWSLEEQRKDEIKRVYLKFNSPANRFDHHDRRRNW
jgi:hypothetical protein